LGHKHKGKEHVKSSNVVKLVGAVALVLAMAANLALGTLGPPDNPGIIPIKDTVAGKTYGEWGDAWWQWAFSIPAVKNPVADTTGRYTAMGQPDGPVWFLAGTFGGAAERTVTIPAGKMLFFPIVNQVWVNLPEWGDNPWSKDQESYARDLIGALIDTAADLACEIDGVAVQHIAAYRCRTPQGGEFMVHFPKGDIWGLVGNTDVNGDIFQPGYYGPSVQDGIFLMLAPLSPGQHTIHFTATTGGGTWGLEVTYHLRVK
jgi:hypothetical protein